VVEKRNAFRFLCEEVTEREGFQYLAVDCLIILNSCSFTYIRFCRFQWPRSLRHRPAATCLLGLWVRIPPGAWMSVCCEYCVLSRILTECGVSECDSEGCAMGDIYIYI